MKIIYFLRFQKLLLYSFILLPAPMAHHHFALEHFHAKQSSPCLLDQAYEAPIILPRITMKRYYQKPYKIVTYISKSRNSIIVVLGKLPASVQYGNSNKYKKFQAVHHIRMEAQMSHFCHHCQAPTV